MVTADQSISRMVTEACARHAGRTAFSCMGAHLGFAELDRLSTFLAHWFVAAGFAPGERVAIQLPNLLQYPVVALGVLKAGLVIVNVNPLYTAAELRHQLRDSGARVLVAFANTAHTAARIVADTAVERVIVTEAGDLHPFGRRQAINFVVRRVRKLVPAFRFPAQDSLRAALAAGEGFARRAPQALAGREVGTTALALLQYTGGTTGIAKAAMLSHGNLVANTRQLAETLRDECPPPGALMVAPLPLYHIYAFTMNLLSGIHAGHHTLLIPNPRDQAGFIAALRGQRISGFVGINTLYKALCDNPAFARLDFSRLALCSSGGMALSPQVAQRWHELTGCRIMEGYGLTECSPLVACNRDYRAGSVGRPAAGTEVSIRGPDGSELGQGMPGEICVRGPQVMQGYWQQAGETARVLDAAGWLRTGDVGVLDADGCLRIVDRLKDLIIVSGFNVYPNEIEDHVCAHPQVREAAVVGLGDEYAARIKLFVVRTDAGLTEERVLSWCREGLAPYKVPRAVEFRDSLPKSNVGKVLRRELRAAHDQQEMF